jgi:hypothetical protein
MALDGTYSGLTSSVASWMNRTDLATVIPDFVTIVESRIARDLRLRNQIVTTTLNAVASVQSVALPTDWLEFENLSVTLTGTPDTNLQYLTIEQIDAKYPNGGGTSRPFVYTIEGPNLLLGPVPDVNYALGVLYYARFASLITAGTNWLMTNFPNVYLYGALREAALFTMNDERAAHWDTLYTKTVKDVQDIDDTASHSGSAIRVKYL